MRWLALLQDPNTLRTQATEPPWPRLEPVAWPHVPITLGRQILNGVFTLPLIDFSDAWLRVGETSLGRLVHV
jgi:hypothetical protein